MTPVTIDPETNLASCVCGWAGVPTILDSAIHAPRRRGIVYRGHGAPVAECPSCETAVGLDAAYGQETRRLELATALRTAGRNDPCPCGSGRKTKKCCAA